MNYINAQPLTDYTVSNNKSHHHPVDGKHLPNVFLTFEQMQEIWSKNKGKK